MSQTTAIKHSYRWPLVLALITVAGLLFALFGDDGWDVLSWLLLAVPVVLLVWLIFFRKSGKRKRPTEQAD